MSVESTPVATEELRTDGDAVGHLVVVGIPLREGVDIIGEYLCHQQDAVTVVLLHAPERDLDDHRSLAWLLFHAGFNVLNLDLPGHGMSGGDAADLGPALVAAVALVDPTATRGVAFVAEGRSGAALMSLPPRDAVAVVLASPRPDASAPAADPDWERVPTLFIVDPAEADSERYAQALAEDVHAWNMRCFVHHDDSEARDPATQRADRPASTWAVQSASLTRGFLLEQSFYWQPSRAIEEGTL